jgi:hypothetical protein
MKVKIKPEFCDNPKESESIFLVIENNGDRLLIEPEIWPQHIKPLETIRTDNVEVIEP